MAIGQQAVGVEGRIQRRQDGVGDGRVGEATAKVAHPEGDPHPEAVGQALEDGMEGQANLGEAEMHHLPVPDMQPRDDDRPPGLAKAVDHLPPLDLDAVFRQEAVLGGEFGKAAADMDPMRIEQALNLRIPRLGPQVPQQGAGAVGGTPAAEMMPKGGANGGDGLARQQAHEVMGAVVQQAPGGVADPVPPQRAALVPAPGRRRVEDIQRAAVPRRVRRRLHAGHTRIGSVSPGRSVRRATASTTAPASSSSRAAWRRVARQIIASARPSCWPVQTRGPVLKGM